MESRKAIKKIGRPVSRFSGGLGIVPPAAERRVQCEPKKTTT